MNYHGEVGEVVVEIVGADGVGVGIGVRVAFTSGMTAAEGVA